MKIELTKEQLTSLVKLVYLGSWMVNSWRVEEDPDEELEDAEYLVMSAAVENGLENYVEADKKEKKAFPTAELDEKMSAIIDSYNDNTFWDELIFRMADRDFLRKYGEDAFDELATEGGMDKERPFIEKYEKEFYENGLDRLEIKREH